MDSAIAYLKLASDVLFFVSSLVMNLEMKQTSAAMQQLRAGPWTAEFHSSTAAIRNICCGSLRVWTELAMLVRDDQWQVVPANITVEVLQRRDDTFSIQLRSLHDSSSIHFSWQGTIQGMSNGVITYEFSGVAQSAFEANRIGFCLLWPSVPCAGRPLQQTRTDGTIMRGRFPQSIEPQIVGEYSIKDLRKLAYELPGGGWAEAEFEGEVFETEDQRNWTDASFKTYGTPLEQPFPVAFRPGDRRQQRVTLRFLGDSSDPITTHSVRVKCEQTKATERNCKVQFSESDIRNLAPKPAPELGLTINNRQPITHDLRKQLAQLGLTTLRADLFTANPAWQQRLQAACREARELDVVLELALQLPSSAPINLTEIASAINRSEVGRVLVYRRGQPATETDIIRQLRQRLSSSIPLGGGSDANFCELNREFALGNLDLTDLDVIAWSINPQVHTSDDQPVMETVHSLSAMVATARRMEAGKPVAITPITLLPRFNAVTRNTETDHGFPDPRVDPRQHQPIIATWMIATWLELAIADVASTTWFESYGACGLLTSDKSNSVADAFRALMTDAKSVVPCRTDTHDAVAAVVDYGARQQLVVANLVGTDLHLTVECAGVMQSTAVLPSYGTYSQPFCLSSLKRAQHE